MDNSIITRTDLYHLLHQLSHDRPAENTPLANLHVVRKSLEEAGFAVNERSRHLELGRLVLEIAESELARLRREAGTPAHSVEAGHKSRIVEDYGRGQRELEAWSAVYHVYLRPDLDLGLNGFAALIRDRHKRTIQRRLSRGVDALTARLQELERAAEAASVTGRVAARLPAPTACGLVGADDVINRAVPLLCGGNGPSVIGLSGPGGIGKTEVALHLAQRALESGVFQDIVWLSAANGDFGSAFSRNSVFDTLGKKLGTVGSDVREALARRSTLTVIDGLDDPLLAMIAAMALGDIRWPSKTLFTGRFDWSSVAQTRRLDVPPLDSVASRALMRREAALTGLNDVAQSRDDELRPLVAATAGHPGAIKLAVTMLHSSDVKRVTEDFENARGAPAELYRRMWHFVWERASTDVRSLVLTAIQLRSDVRQHEAAVVREASRLAESTFSQTLRDAVSCGLLVPSGTASQRSYRPGLFVTRYLLQCGLIPTEWLGPECPRLSAA